MNIRACKDIVKRCPMLKYIGHSGRFKIFSFGTDRHPSVAIELDGVACSVFIAKFIDDEDDTVARRIGRVTVYQKMDLIRFNKEVDKIVNFLNSSRVKEIDRGNILSCL